MWKNDLLAGQRVLVTAGAAGIGLEISRAFAEAGARVMVCDVAQASLDALAAALPGASGRLADVSDALQVQALFKAVDNELGGLDILVNNAGVAGPTGAVETLELADWQRTLDVNITGAFLCTRLAVPRLRQSARGPAGGHRQPVFGGRPPGHAGPHGLFGVQVGGDRLHQVAGAGAGRRRHPGERHPAGRRGRPAHPRCDCRQGAGARPAAGGRHAQLRTRPRWAAWPRRATLPTWPCLLPARWPAMSRARSWPSMA